MIAFIVCFGLNIWPVSPPETARPLHVLPVPAATAQRVPHGQGFQARRPALSPYAAAHRRSVRDGVPFVVLVTAESFRCEPCERLKVELASWSSRTDIAFVVIGDQSKEAQALPVVAYPTTFIWTDVRRPGKRVRGFHLASALNRLIVGPVKRVAAAISAWPPRRDCPYVGVVGMTAQWHLANHAPHAAILRRHGIDPRRLSDQQAIEWHNYCHWVSP